MSLRRFGPTFAIVGLLFATLSAQAESQNPEALVVEAATASSDDKREANLRSLVEYAAKLPASEQLPLLWRAVLLAQSYETKEAILAQAGKLPLPEAQMLIYAYQFDSEMAGQVNAARKSLTTLFKATSLPEETSDSFKTPSLTEKWEDPDGYTGRWSNGRLQLDVIPYPAGNYLAILTDASDERQKLLGLNKGNTLALHGPGVEGSVNRNGATVKIAGQEHALKRTTVGKTNTIPKPDNAVTILDGKNLAAFDKPSWKLLPDGAVEVIPKNGGMRTREGFADQRIYLEFRTPWNAEAIFQKRSNSGVFPMGSYEVQVLDSFGLEPQYNDCGAIYSVSAPKVNAAAPPLEWQSYVIEFHAPRFDAGGKKTENARISVWLNGVLIQDNIEIPRLTGHDPKSTKPSRPEPSKPSSLSLQEHSNAIQYRNIWIEPLKN